ncbi:hypothetical protein M8J75_008543 [Diaphorina citri]|nr:hypothetical protein M8J75_008543 [Diaphorina citri]
MGLRGLSEGKVYGDWTGDYGGKDDFDEKEYDGDSNNEDDKGEHHNDEGKSMLIMKMLMTWKVIPVMIMLVVIKI